MVCKINELFLNFFQKKFQKDLVNKEKGSTFAPAKENGDRDREKIRELRYLERQFREDNKNQILKKKFKKNLLKIWLIN
jgi:hypothetical protein